MIRTFTIPSYSGKSFAFYFEAYTIEQVEEVLKDCGILIDEAGVCEFIGEYNDLS